MNFAYVSDATGYLPVVRNGKVTAWAKVDADALAAMSRYEWHLHALGYVQRQQQGRSLFLHREVLGLPPGASPRITFRDRSDLLDCRRSNLEVARTWLLEQLGLDPQLRSTMASVALGAAASRKPAA